MARVATSRPRLAVAVGDPRGIGPEVVQKALRQPLDADITIVGDGERVGGPRTHPLTDTAAGRLAASAIETAANMALRGEVDAIVTGPVHKLALHAAGYRYPGVTEFLSHLAGDTPVAMMLATGRLRVVLVTTHLPLRDAITSLTTERIVAAGRLTTDALRQWWGIAEPRLAVCALNPHAGEGGLFGDEDDRVLKPAAAALGAVGPLPADTVFVKALRGEFDAVLAPYHDVGMTAVKVSGFGTGVNVTLGLPFIRTSPDHGTAFDIAGKGIADAGSMRAALELAVHLAGARRAGND
ncbi:MAG: 4-hydroxythreonine-4-phosphate dehydrogenase PdxA [Gemmatimonadales bacterium]